MLLIRNFTGINFDFVLFFQIVILLLEKRTNILTEGHIFQVISARHRRDEREPWGLGKGIVIIIGSSGSPDWISTFINSKGSLYKGQYQFVVETNFG